MTSIFTLLAFSLIIMLMVFLLKLSSLPPQIPLFYSRLEGDDQIADLWLIFLLPFLMIVNVVVNRWLTVRYFHDNQFIQRLTYSVNSALIGIITVIFLRLIFLVT